MKDPRLGTGDLWGQRQLYVEGGRQESCAIYDNQVIIFSLNLPFVILINLRTNHQENIENIILVKVYKEGRNPILISHNTDNYKKTGFSLSNKSRHSAYIIYRVKTCFFFKFLNWKLSNFLKFLFRSSYLLLWLMIFSTFVDCHSLECNGRVLTSLHSLHRFLDTVIVYSLNSHTFFLFFINKYL